MKKAVMSNKPKKEGLSDKLCVCGGHQGKRGKKKFKPSRETIRRKELIETEGDDGKTNKS